MSETGTRIGKRINARTAARRGFYDLGDQETVRVLSAGILARWASGEHPPTPADMAEWQARLEWQQAAQWEARQTRAWGEGERS